MRHCAIAYALLLLLTPLACAQQFVDWTDTSSGTINATTFALTGLADDPPRSLSPYDLTDTPFLAMPGAGDQESVNFLCTDDWTLTFGQPQTKVRLYAIAWRGADVGVTPAQYTFTQPFVIESGFTGASIAGNTLSLPDGNFYDGILKFSDAFTSLTATSSASLENAQAMTFSAAPLPEPTFTLSLALSLLLSFNSRRRARSG